MEGGRPPPAWLQTIVTTNPVSPGTNTPRGFIHRGPQGIIVELAEGID